MNQIKFYSPNKKSKPMSVFNFGSKNTGLGMTQTKPSFLNTSKPVGGGIFTNPTTGTGTNSFFNKPANTGGILNTQRTTSTLGGLSKPGLTGGTSNLFNTGGTSNTGLFSKPNTGMATTGLFTKPTMGTGLLTGGNANKSLMGGVGQNNFSKVMVIPNDAVTNRYIQNTTPISQRKDIPYSFLFKSNTKRVKREDHKQGQLERKYDFLFEGFPHNHIYKVKDFNTFAGQKVR